MTDRHRLCAEASTDRTSWFPAVSKVAPFKNQGAGGGADLIESPSWC